MSSESWIALAALGVTLQTGLLVGVARVAVLMTNVRRDIKDIRENHLFHIEKDIALLKEFLFKK